MISEHACELLLTACLSDDKACRLLQPAGFADWRDAASRLQRLATDPASRTALARVLPHLLLTLANVAGPDRVLVNLERFAQSTSRQATWHYLADQPRALEILATLFAGSQFLTEILLRHPEYLARLVEHKRLSHLRDHDQILAEAREIIAAHTTTADQLDALRRYQRWELLRIGACDLLDLFDLPVVTAQLSELADGLVTACLEIAAAQGETSQDGLAVIALGKLGGRELNYSSDIDLLFIANSVSMANQRLGARLIAALSDVTSEGFLYRVDMRLRPWGQTGALVCSPDGYIAYLERHARLWEKQALLKARVIAGDRSVGEAFLQRIQGSLYDLDACTLRSVVRAMKERTEAQLRQRGREWGEVKLGEGSIRDIEFVTQYLQLTHGRAHPEIRSGNTLDGLLRLANSHLLSTDEHRVLVDGYILFRKIEHYLQMMHYRQTHILPDDTSELRHLARRLGFEGDDANERFVERYEQHRAAIRAVYLRHLGGNDMPNHDQIEPSPPSPAVQDHVARMDPSYAATFSADEIRRHAVLADQLDRERLVQVDATALADGRWRVTIVAYDYPGELSLICGLLFVYGVTIDDGDVFTYEPQATTPAPRRDARRKIVDVFTVTPVRHQVTAETWQRYQDDLAGLLRLMQSGQQREAQGELAKRVAAALHDLTTTTSTLYPVEIEIDNDTSAHYTVLRIRALDTIGFLYEFTNALALTGVYIARVAVDTTDNRVRDTLYVTDANGNKITSPIKQRELRAATVLIKHFTHLLPRSSNPESALLHFREFIADLFQRPNWPDELASLERQEVLDALARLLGVSDFLWDDFLRMQYANLFPVVRDVDALSSAKSRAQLQADLEAALRPVHAGPQPPSEDAPWRVTLNAFKDREMFRIDMRHILGYTGEFWDFAKELTDLTEVIINAAYHLCHEDLRSVYGTPLTESGQVSDMSVCALGKCGGRELGFASDIELMFIYAANGKTTGPTVITTAEFYEKLVQNCVSAIQAKREGIFQIDLQLRPYGKAGSLAVSMESFRRYFGPDGPAWPYERQALVKLRPIAGNSALGAEITRLRDAFVYTGEPFDVTAMRAMRERQVRHLVNGGTLNAKYSPGGLADLEYLVQGLQIIHGAQHPAVRCTNIREAMAVLAAVGALSAEDYARLRRAHTFLRWLIDALRMVRGNAKDLTVPPPDSEEFAFLARRLRYGNNVAQLREDLARHTSAVQELNNRLLG